MNCKPGELAIVIHIPPKGCKSHLCRIVECDYLVNSWDGKPCWIIKKPIKDSIGTCIGIADSDLRPIRGGESTDIETIEREKETAL